MNYQEEALRRHAAWRGKFELTPRAPLDDRDDLSTAYTPGVAEPCRRIAVDKDLVYTYTRRWNLVAVVTDGSAVLGLGNIGPEAALPVMEGKAVLFKSFADVDGFPICLATQDVDKIVETICLIAPTFGGINLEDISAPRCFEVEERLIDAVDIPVFHDDQHGTAVVTLAALFNAVRITGQTLADLRVVINGSGAAGIAVANLLYLLGVRQTILVDSKGIVQRDRSDLNERKRRMLATTNPTNLKGDLAAALRGAHVFIGVSVANVVTPEMVKSMNPDPIIFALANPDPEIAPEAARAAGARIVGTGRSDFPNQINNVLGFPGIFRGALDVRARCINDDMKIAAARALAGHVADKQLRESFVLPSPLDRSVALKVAAAVAQAARAAGVART